MLLDPIEELDVVGHGRSLAIVTFHVGPLIY